MSLPHPGRSRARANDSATRRLGARGRTGPWGRGSRTAGGEDQQTRHRADQVAQHRRLAEDRHRALNGLSMNFFVPAVLLVAWLPMCTASCTRAVATEAPGQAISPVFSHGANYTFERMHAVRTVRDAFDQGPITLVAYVYRPLKLDRRDVVLYSHGSTAGYAVSPKEPRAPERSVIQFFTSRGYTVVAPMRRGVSESSGTYREECPVQSGACTLAENTALFDSGLQEAVLDSR